MANTILTIDDHGEIRRLIRLTLEYRHFQVLEAVDGLQGLAMARQHRPDLILLDVMMPGLDGLSVSKTLSADAELCAIPVVVLSALADADTVSKVMKAGASGYVSKAGSSNELLDALRAVLSGEIYLPQKLQELASRSGSAQAEGKPLAQRFGLTAAQARVLDLLAEGRSNRQIGELLGLTEGTVKIHVSAIMKAMGVSNRAEAALLASRKRRTN